MSPNNMIILSIFREKQNLKNSHAGSFILYCLLLPLAININWIKTDSLYLFTGIKSKQYQ